MDLRGIGEKGGISEKLGKEGQFGGARHICTAPDGVGAQPAGLGLGMDRGLE